MNIDRLSEPVKGRKYESPTRRAQAEATRRQIADAAWSLFVERGWSGTRVRDVAQAAGVAEPTVYAVYGNKAGLASALLYSLEGAADPRRFGAELRAAAGDPRGQLAAVAGFERRLFEHGAEAITVIREAGRTVPELAKVVAEGRARGEAQRRRLFEGWPADAWRDGVGVDDALDYSAALYNADSFLLLTQERGWSPERVERWWHDTLVQLLLR
jgi:AcrR family transcriptional regulator